MKKERRITPQQDIFIQLVARGNNYSDAYRQAMNKGQATAKSANEQGSKLAKRYEYEIQQAKEAHRKAIEEARGEEIIKKALAGLLTQAEVDAKLCSIIRGNCTVERVLVVSGTIQKYPNSKPDHGEILRAVDIYNKRFGSYAAQAVDVTSGGDKLPTQTIIKWGDKEIPV